MAKGKTRIKLKIPFAGKIGGVDSPPSGFVIEMDDDVARQMVKEGTAELEEEEEEPKRKLTERGGARVEEARSEAPEKRGRK